MYRFLGPSFPIRPQSFIQVSVATCLLPALATRRPERERMASKWQKSLEKPRISSSLGPRLLLTTLAQGLPASLSS